MNNKIARAISLLLCSAMLVSSAACSNGAAEKTAQVKPAAAQAEQSVYTEKAASVRKNETVYVNLDPSGKVLSTTVTDWLHTPKGQVYIDDISDLKGIENIKSDIQPVANGSALRWHMDSTDLYYSGTTSKKLPVDIAVSYTLDGKAVTPEEIAGKSGKVEIKTTAKNTFSTEVKVDGKTATMYLPVMVIGIAILDEARFSGVTVSNGLAVGDASKEIAVTVSFPGMTESLGLDQMELTAFGDYQISDTTSITADAVDFELGNMYYAVLPLCAVDLGLITPDSVDDLKLDIERLSKIISAISTADLTTLMDALTANPDTITGLENMISTATSLYSSNKELLEVLSKYMTEENITAVSNLLADAESADVAEALKLLQNPIIQAFFDGLPEMMDDLDVLLPALESLEADLQDEDVQKSIDNMPETLSQLSDLLAALNENRELIEALTKLVDSDAMDSIGSVLSEMDAQDIGDDIIKYDKVIEHSDKLLANIEQWVKFGNSYRIFTAAAEGTDTNLMFVYQTRSITHTEPAAVTQEETAEPWYEKLMFWK